MNFRQRQRLAKQVMLPVGTRAQNQFGAKCLILDHVARWEDGYQYKVKWDNGVIGYVRPKGLIKVEELNGN